MSRRLASRLAPALLAIGLLASGRAEGDRRDQRAADLYSDGVKLIKAGKYRQGAEKINAALARGATEPVDAQGTEQRYLARPYDPYYWLGVAQMELGLVEQALGNLEKSETMVPVNRKSPVLADFPEEWADLKRRKAVLLSRLEAAPPERPAGPTPAPTVLAIRLPERPPEPVAVPATVPASAATPAAAPAPSGLREALVASIGAARGGRPVEAERLAEKAQRLFPSAPQPDILLSSLRASRYLLEGGKDPRLLASARAAFSTWRQKVAPARPVPPFVSPRVRALLDGAR